MLDIFYNLFGLDFVNSCAFLITEDTIINPFSAQKINKILTSNLEHVSNFNDNLEPPKIFFLKDILEERANAQKTP